jgi:hypothetical protein
MIETIDKVISEIINDEELMKDVEKFSKGNRKLIADVLSSPFVGTSAVAILPTLMMMATQILETAILIDRTVFNSNMKSELIKTIENFYVGKGKMAEIVTPKQ